MRFGFRIYLLLIQLLLVYTKFLLVLREKNITGNAETPFLLARVNELTGGLSLASSILSLKFIEQYFCLFGILWT